MKSRAFKYIFLALLGAFLFNLSPAMGQAELRKAILVIADRSDPNLTQREEALKKYLVYYRQKMGYDSSTLPILVYDFSHPRVQKYCRTQLNISEKDLIFLGIVTARGTLPEKIHFKVINPQNLNLNSKLIVEKATGAKAGALRVTSSPRGAKVWLNKSYKGLTPLTITGIPSGKHIITLVKQGFVKTRKEVTVSNAKQETVVISMPSRSGTLIARSELTGADVYIDNVYYGKTPLRLDNLSPGHHSIVMKKGTSTWRGTVRIKSGETAEIAGQLDTHTAQATPTPTSKPTSTPVHTPVATNNPTPRFTPVQPVDTPEPDFTPDVTMEVKEAFIPRTEQNSVFRVSVSNIEEVNSIKDYYKPKPGYKFVVVYLSQQNISDEMQIYTGQFGMVDQANSSYESLDELSNFWMVVLKPGGMNLGYLVYEIPQDAKAMAVVLHGLNMSPLSISLK